MKICANAGCGVEFHDDGKGFCPECEAAVARSVPGMAHISGQVLAERQAQQKKIADQGDAQAPRRRVTVRDDATAARRCSVSDLVTVSSRKLTDEGYLIAPGALARTGIQDYTAHELGIEASDRIIRLNRPPDEVFEADSLASFEGKPITVNHPTVPVTAENWREYAVGDVRDVKQDGDLMAGTLILRDKYAIYAVMDGKQALSNGYDFDLDMTPGHTADGQSYDGVQRKIRGNHVAIVDVGRAGPNCRIADNDPTRGERNMAMKKITLDGFQLELDETQASIVETLVGGAKKTAADAEVAKISATKRATDAEQALKDLQDTHAKTVADHAAKLAELEGKILKPAALDTLVAERTKVIADAAKLAPELKTEGKAPHQIRTEVLAHVVASDNEALAGVAKGALAGIEPAKAGEVVARVALDAVLSVAATQTDGGEDGKGDGADDDLGRRLAGDGGDEFRRAAKGNGEGKLRGRDLYVEKLTNAWKGKQQVAGE